MEAPDNNFLQKVLKHIVNENLGTGTHRITLTRPDGHDHKITYSRHNFNRGIYMINFNNRAIHCHEIESNLHPSNVISQDLIDFNYYSFLKFINLSNNKLSGTIGDKFNKLTDLIYLYLHSNVLEGEINEINLYNCKSLRVLTLGDNKFSDYEYQRRQLRSTIPQCEVNFYTEIGREKKLFIHLTWIQVEGKIYNRVFGTYDEALSHHESQYQHYNGMHTMAILDLKIDQDEILDNENGPTVKIKKWHGYYFDRYNNDLKEYFIKLAEISRCAFLVHGDFRPFIFVKHVGYGTRSEQIIERYSDLQRAIQRLENDSDGKAMAVYDKRNGLSNIREVKYKGERIVVHTPEFLWAVLGLDNERAYSIENDFNEWIKKDGLIFSKYFQKAICAAPLKFHTNKDFPFVAMEVC
jgi:hypothetical protein